MLFFAHKVGCTKWVAIPFERCPRFASSAQRVFEQVVKAVAHEAKAAAVGAARFATGAAGAVRGGLLKTFLPVGYPKSVRPEYLRYRGWDIIQVRPSESTRMQFAFGVS